MNIIFECQVKKIKIYCKNVVYMYFAIKKIGSGKLPKPIKKKERRRSQKDSRSVGLPKKKSFCSMPFGTIAVALHYNNHSPK